MVSVHAWSLLVPDTIVFWLIAISIQYLDLIMIICLTLTRRYLLSAHLSYLVSGFSHRDLRDTWWIGQVVPDHVLGEKDLGVDVELALCQLLSHL